MFKYLYIYMPEYKKYFSTGQHVKKNVKKVLEG